jgi:hypothetical protein
MILASDLVADLKFLVDDENSDRYSFDNDYKPAINLAVRYIMSAFDKAFERGSLSPSVFSELLYAQITSVAAIPLVDGVKVALTNPLFVNEQLWRVVGVDPVPIVSGTDYVMAGARLAKFLPILDSGEVNNDPFAEGHTDAPADLDTYFYTQINTISFDTTPAQYLIVRPAPPGSVAVIVLRNPTKVTLTTTNVEFPYVLYQPLLMKAYKYMMVQAGSQPLANMQLSDQEVQELVALFR